MRPILITDLITTKEAARIIGVGPRRVRQLIQAGELPDTPAGQPIGTSRRAAEEYTRRPRGKKKAGRN